MGSKSSLNECNLIDSYPQRILLIPLLGLGQTVFPDFIGIKTIYNGEFDPGSG